MLGFATATWAPLVPFAKARAGLDEGALGLLLFCVGGGAILDQPSVRALMTAICCSSVSTFFSANRAAVLRAKSAEGVDGQERAGGDAHRNPLFARSKNRHSQECSASREFRRGGSGAIVDGDRVHFVRCQLHRDSAHLTVYVVLADALGESRELPFDVFGPLPL